MQKVLATISTAVLLAACSDAEVNTSIPSSDTTAVVRDSYDIQRQYEKFAEVQMNPDVSFLTESERKVVNKLIEASGYLSQIYLLQRGADYPERRAKIQERAGKLEYWRQ